MTKRTLVLKRETLSELTPTDLARVVGAGPPIPTLDADCDATTLCITKGDGITCAPCRP
jgi:hypothetical protein